MLQLTDNMTYEFTATDIEKIKTNSSRFDKRFKKGDAEKKKFLKRLGKKGELAFSKIFKDQIKYDEFISKKNGCDFILSDDTRIDVKALDSDDQRRVYIDIDDYHDSDLFVVIRVSETENKASYLGYADSKEAYKNLKYDRPNDCYYVDLSFFSTVK